MKSEAAFPIVDLFAGPGGLGEGFAALGADTGSPRFRSTASFEHDDFSHRTLHLRHFLRSFSGGEFPESYYSYLRGDLSLQELYGQYPEHKDHADSSALRVSLAPENHQAVRDLIEGGLKGARRWVLVGGPPCQAYSLVGRSRMMGDPEFEKDVRHFLYREYLRIIIDHAPPVFVMENVKGLLSATVDGERVIDRIVTDLASPQEALGGNSKGLGYKLHSLVEEELPDIATDPRLFLVRAEEFGVPQARHRMFIVGVRNDIDVRPGRLKPHEPPTLRQTIGDLPPIRSGISKSKDSFEAWRREVAGIDTSFLRRELNGCDYADHLTDRLSSIFDGIPFDLERQSTTHPGRPCSEHAALASMFDPHLDFLDSHQTRGHMPSDLRRYLFATSFAAVNGWSPKLADFPLSILPKHNNVEEGRAGKMFADRFRVQLPDQPSTVRRQNIWDA